MASRFDDPRALPTLREPLPESWNFSIPIVAAMAALCGVVAWSAAELRPKPQVEVTTEFRGPLDTADAAVGTTGTLDTLRPGGVVYRRLPTGRSVAVRPGSPEDRLTRYLSSPGTTPTAFDLDSVTFIPGSDRLRPIAFEQMRNVAAVLSAYPNAIVIVTGYTPAGGNEAANLKLSRARAAAVAQILTRDGVDPSRIHSEGFGSMRPVDKEAPEQGTGDGVAIEVVPR